MHRSKGNEVGRWIALTAFLLSALACNDATSPPSSVGPLIRAPQHALVIPSTSPQVSASANHTCALKTDGTVVCWGDDTYGQTTVPAGLASVAQVSSGGYYTCALKTDGTVVCWGNNAFPVPAGLNLNVQDITPPVTTINSAVDGNGAPIASGGATLSSSIAFTFTGTDAVGVVGFQCSLDAAPYVTCSSPETYSALVVGTHTFRVSAADAAGNVSIPASFTWAVVTPAQATQNLITTITSMGLPTGVANSLIAPLKNIDTNHLAPACGKLNAFVSQVNFDVQTGQLTMAAASQLLQAANAILASLGCG
jgi:Regulator of chromosome condensation (RCC1) repeat